MDSQLVEEALAVGAFLVPVYALVRKSLVWRDEASREYVSVFLSGALFHVISEASGVNEWYLTHGRANQKWLWTKHNAERTRRPCASGICSLALRLRED